VTRAEIKLLPAAIVAGLFVSLAACKNSEEQHTVELKQMDGSQVPAKQIVKSKVDMDLNQQIEFSKNDLSQRLSIDPASVAVSSSRFVNWRSGALGCPKPGLMYTQALVPGASIFLQAGNQIYAYHAKPGGQPFYCPRERVEQPAMEPGADDI